MFNIIIFSKDRAAQLDLLLRSLKLNLKEFKDCRLSILYNYSSDEYLQAYKQIENNNELGISINFIPDNLHGSFKESLLRTIDLKNQLTMFLVDDIIFKTSFSLEDREIQFVKNNQEIIAHSLRLWKGIDYCYATNNPNSIPKFVKGCIWNWTNAEGDWNYPMSVDGNIYRTNFIFEKINQINFKNPNQLEAGLSATVDRNKLYLSCYVEESKLLNIPANIVQQTYANRHGNIISVKELNDSFLNNKRLSYEHVLNYQNNTVHVEIPLKWIGD